MMSANEHALKDIIEEYRFIKTFIPWQKIPRDVCTSFAENAEEYVRMMEPSPHRSNCLSRPEIEALIHRFSSDCESNGIKLDEARLLEIANSGELDSSTEVALNNTSNLLSPPPAPAETGSAELENSLEAIIEEYRFIETHIPWQKIPREVCTSFAENAEEYVRMMEPSPYRSNCLSRPEIEALIHRFSSDCESYGIKLDAARLLEIANDNLEVDSSAVGELNNADDGLAPSPAPAVTSIAEASRVSASPAPAPGQPAK